MAPGVAGFLSTAWPSRERELRAHRASWNREGAVDVVCVKIMRGEPISRADERLIRSALRAESQWARRLIVGMCACSLYLRKGDPRRATLALARCADGYRGLESLRKRLKVADKPEPITDFEDYCRRTLAAFEPPLAAGPSPVASIIKLASQFPNRQRSRHRETIDALDALITAGRDVAAPDLEERVVRQLARMLHARVLMHWDGNKYVHLEPQQIHTLSTWTLVRIRRTETVKARRIRPRPEFWRPEQRRPAGILTLPIGAGVACLARKHAFTAKEARAVRVVLSLLAKRTGAPVHQPSAATQPPMQSRMKGLIGNSKPWRRVLDQVWRVAPKDCSVLIRGETGTGKELIARALHFNSSRAGGPFVALNCAALNPETHLAELFGHVRGAFTGAIKARRGLVRQAHRGTLFLDELGDMPTATQVALLRVLQERKVRAVGSVRDMAVDIRVIAATNRDLAEKVEEGEFRMDLFHRLAVMELELPPLRERLDDVPALADHFMRRLGGTKRLHMDAVSALGAHTWPGNVRELDNVVQAAVLLADGDVVHADVIRNILAGRKRARAAPEPRLAPRAAAILKKLAEAWWSAPALARELGVSTRTVNRELARLLDEGLVERFGEARASRYRDAAAVGRDSDPRNSLLTSFPQFVGDCGI